MGMCAQVGMNLLSRVTRARLKRFISCRNRIRNKLRPPFRKSRRVADRIHHKRMWRNALLPGRSHSKLLDVFR